MLKKSQGSPSASSVKLSVIIPCYNAAQTIETQLNALSDQDWPEPWEIIIADNGSTDGSVSYIQQCQKKMPNLKLVDASARRGPAFAQNVGVHAATGDILLFCDADDEAGPGWAMAMGNALRKYDFVAGKIDTEKLNSSVAQKARVNTQRNGLQPYEYPPYLPHAQSASLGVKRWVYDAVGGFDEEFRAIQDTDFCWKVQLRGTKLHFVSDALLFYRLRDSMVGIFT